jgi:hypothetical protein
MNQLLRYEWDDNDIEIIETENFESNPYPVLKNMEKVDFEYIDKTLMTEEDQLVNEIEGIIQSIAVEVTDKIVNKKIIPNKRFDEIDKLKLKYIGDIKLAFKKSFIKMYKEGVKTWKQEQRRQDFADSTEIMPDEYTDWLDSKAFMEAGRIGDAYLNGVKQELLIGIENGYGEKKIISNLNQKFNTEMVAGATQSPIFTMADLQLIVRMNLNASFNKARYINGLALQDKIDYNVYFQFSEVRDGYDYNRKGKLISHPFSGFIHGKYVLAGTELAQRLQYPLHYNDRGLIVTVDDGYAEIPEDMILTSMPDLSNYSGMTIS